MDGGVGNKPRGAERNPIRAERFTFSKEGWESLRKVLTWVHNFLAAKEAPRPISVWLEGGSSWVGERCERCGPEPRAPFLMHGRNWDMESTLLLSCRISFIYESRGRGRIIGKDSRCCLACSGAPSWRAVLVFYYGSFPHLSSLFPSSHS